MVCSVSAIQSAGAAGAYYSQTDDYYRDAGYAPTAWQGKGAEALGLRGEVETAQAEAMLEGRLPNGSRVGGDDHRPGWDATFSAPKSVSVAAYVHGDDRLIAAHDKAVREALSYLERETAATRIREGGQIRTEATGNLIAATYRHDTSREREPQMHTHAVIMNATQSADGQWRSLESRPLYRLQTEAGAVYRAALAREAERLGYTIEKTQEGKHPSFELREVSKAERELFSSRSRQIANELAKMGLTRETATAEQKQIATLNTRQDKENLDRGELLREWRQQARVAGHESGQRPEVREIDRSIYERRADVAVKEAVAHLAERESRFTQRQIESEARKVGMGGIDDRDIKAAIERAKSRHDLAPTSTRQYDAITGMKQEGAGFTTREARQIEMKMLAQADRAAGAAQPAVSLEQANVAIERQEAASGHKFNQAQADATRAVLAGEDRIALVQGYAGTAKTTSVLAASAAEFRQQGYEVVALAPTHSAAETLGNSIGAEAQTVASFIHGKAEQSDKPRVYMVDEASLLSTKDMEKLLDRTQDNRVVLVGDVKQLGSVEAGAAFRQLQEDSKLETHALDQIVRQKDDELRDAVKDVIRGDAFGALEKVQVRELNTRKERVADIAKIYSEMDRAGREDTMIIAPGRDDRREINEAVRNELNDRGELQNEKTIQTLDRKDMTASEASRAASYSVGDHIQAWRDYKSLDMEKGETARVVEVDVDRNHITLENDRGDRKEIDPSKYSKLQAYESRELQVAEGDRLVHRENTADLKNGAALTVEKIDDRHIHARDESGKLYQLKLDKTYKLDHGYAQTAHEAQGRTCQNVMIHAESDRVNLQNQQSSYVALSRATDKAVVYTDNREKLAAQIERETGQKEVALERNRSGPDKEPPKAVQEFRSEIEARREGADREPKPAQEAAPWDKPRPEQENVRESKQDRSASHEMGR